MENNTLQHWGIKGMRWGLRRYQNADGSLTPAGKKRYNKEMEKLKAEERTLKNKARTQSKMDKLEARRKSIETLRKEAKDRKRREKEEEKREDEIKKLEKEAEKRDKKKLTDDELRDRIARLELEKKYSDLLANDKKVSELANTKKDGLGKRFVKWVGKDMLLPAATDTGRQLVKSLLVKSVNDTDFMKKWGDEYKLATNNKKK